MNARAGGVENQLADGDGHAAGALIAQAEDALVVGDHDQADVALAEVPQALGDLAAVIWDKGTSRAGGGRCGCIAGRPARRWGCK